MKRFKCRLQRVLDVREVAVSQCEAMLAESNRALNARRAEHRKCDEELHQASEKIMAESGKSAHPFHECLAQRAWFQHLSERVQHAAQATQKESDKVDIRRANLKKALLEHKVIENLGTIPSPLTTMPGFDMMRKQQEAFMKTMMGGVPGWAGSGPAKDEAATSAPASAGQSPADELAEIKKQFAELQKKLSKL